MKRFAVLVVLALLTASAAGCKKTDETDGGVTAAEGSEVGDSDAQDSGSAVGETGGTGDVRPDGFVYEQDGVEIVMGAQADAIIEAMGEPLNVFEQPSCAFEGIDKTYYYQDIYVNTFPDGDTDRIMSVNFLSDAVQTPEGLYVGMTVDGMTGIYGDGYRNEQDMYTYEKNGTELAVLTEGGEVVQITYYWKDIEG